MGTAFSPMHTGQALWRSCAPMVITIVLAEKAHKVQAVKASAGKARCVQSMDEEAATREPMVMTQHGPPRCQLTPYRPRPRTLVAVSKETIVMTSDRISPRDVEWEAQQ